MGRKFCNINIKGADAQYVQTIFPNLEVKSLADGWATVVGDELDYTSVRKTAVRISKAVDVPVLSVYYFDEDYAEFVLYRNGRRTARHIPAEYEGFERVRGKHTVWAEQLGIDADAVGVLRAIFDETSPELCLDLLGCVVGCPLSYEAGCEDTAVLPDVGFLEKYLDDKRKAAEAERSASKLKNRHKLTLVDEADGYFGHWLKSYPFVRTEFRPGSVIKSFFEIRDGKLSWMFDTDIRSFESHCGDLPGDGDKFCAVVYNSPVLYGGSMSTYRYEFYVFSYGGEVLDVLGYNKGVYPGICIFTGSEHLIVDGVYRNIADRVTEWQLPEIEEYERARPVGFFDDGRIAFVCKKFRGSDDVISICPDGSGIIKRSFDEYALRYDNAVVFGNELYAVIDRRFVCFDSSLNELWSVDLGNRLNITANSLDRELGILYLYDYGCIMTVDLAERQIAAVRETGDNEHRYFEGALPGKGCIMTDDRSLVEVWDTSLECVSRHRRKGSFHKVLYVGGRVYMASNKPKESDRNSPADGHLWLYELT